MADIRNYLNSFLAYLRIEKTASQATIYDYNKELQKFIDFLGEI